jgi:large subunit ribosomal protein L10
MATTRKREQVQELRERLEKATIVVSAEYRGLSVKEMQELRRRLREGGIEVKVVKNTLLKRAADEAGQPGLFRIVEGPTALAIGYGDVIEASRVITGCLQAAPPGFSVRGGYMDGATLTPNDLRALVALPPRPVLISQFLGTLKGPLAGFVALLDAPLYELVGLTRALLSELPGLIEARARQLEAAAG